MEKAIDEYFKECDSVEYKLDENGEPEYYKGEPILIKKPKPYTITGLAQFLGFTDREALRWYMKQEPETDSTLPRDGQLAKIYDGGFREVIKRAIGRVEQYREEALYSKDTVNGARFALGASGWTSKESLDVNVKNGEIISQAEAVERLKDLGFEQNGRKRKSVHRPC